MSLVVDASVVIKWFVNEPLHENARQILTSREELHAPDLLISEIGNIAWKKVMRGEIEETHARSIVLSLRSLPITLRPSVELIDRALQIATTIKHPVYDCLYLACAETLGSRLVTADEKLRRTLATTTLSMVCRLLGDHYDMSLSKDEVDDFVSLLKQVEKTWKSIKGDDASLYLDTPAIMRVKNAFEKFSKEQANDLEALRLLGGGSGGNDWLLLKRIAKDGLQSSRPTDIISLINQSASIESGWRKFQELVKAHSKLK